MVLIDTSVMISFLRGINNEPVLKFEDLQRKGITFGITNYIYQEIIQGAKTRGEFDLLCKFLSSQKFYELKHGRKSFESAAGIYYNCRMQGITVRSTIDLLIVQTAIENDLYLLHDDKDFSNMAKVEKNLKEY